jgi:selenocysteine lyase/cysteine desulfurase
MELTMDYRNEFADFEGVTYLDAAAQGPLPLVAARAAHAALEWKRLPHTMPEDIYFDLPDRIRAKAARLIGAEPEEIAVTTGASGGLAAVAVGMDWKDGDEVLVARGEFPAHFSTWMPYEQAGKLRVRIVKPRDRFISPEDYIENIGPNTRIVSASLVRFDDGSRLDAVRVAHACHAVGAALLLDLSQCAGAMPLAIRDLGADFAVCGGYKWLLSPYGTGFFWVAREWTERLRFGPVYWQALEGARNFHTLPLDRLRAAPGARRWDSPETASFTNLAAMDASLSLILQVGTESIARHNESLLSEILDRLPRDRCVLTSPGERDRRGPYVCVSAHKAGSTRAFFEKLRGAHVIVSLRENALRIAPHLYNTAEDVRRLVKILSAE